MLSSGFFLETNSSSASRTAAALAPQPRHCAGRAHPSAAVLRLLLVPLGHLTGRLPLGNAGRSNISAFQAMPIREDIAALIEQVAQAVDGTR